MYKMYNLKRTDTWGDVAIIIIPPNLFSDVPKSSFFPIIFNNHGFNGQEVLNNHASVIALCIRCHISH